MAKKTKITSRSKRKTLGKPVNVSGVSGGTRKPPGCGCTAMPQDPVGSIIKP